MMNEEAKIKEFLDLFKGSFSEKILCHSIDDVKVTRMKNHVSIEEALWANKQFQKDVYFYVNNGGTKKFEINELVAVFVDLDTGRDQDGNYYPTEYVRSKKMEMLDLIKKFPVASNVIVETRNGLHIYWILDPVKVTSVSLAQWETAMNRVKSFFKDVGADQYVGKPNQIMRVPYTIWSKNYTGLKEFLCLCEITSTSPITLDGFLALTKDIVAKAPSFQDIIRAPSYTGPASPKAVQTWLQRQTGENTMFGNIVNKVVKKAAKKKVPTQQTSQDNLETMLAIKEFLLEISPQLFYKHMKFSSKTAKDLADKITRDFGV